MGGEAEVATAVVEAIMFSMVNEKTIRRRKNQVVQPDNFGLEERAARDGAKGVEGPVRAAEAPFVSAEAVVIIEVNYCEPEFFDANEADGMAEAEAIIH